MRPPLASSTTARPVVTTTARRSVPGAATLARALRGAGDRHPVTERDAPPAPDGWVVAPPDYVGVGVERGGTSWWDSLLLAHPSVSRAPGIPKELHYFDRFWDRDCSDADVARYHAFFPRPAGHLTGEWTPGYLVDPWTPPLLRRAAPDARFLVLLRDPVERFRSGRHQARQRARAASSPRAAANAAFQRGLYADQLDRLWRAVPRDRTLVLQLERCIRDPRAQLDRTFRFLGLDPAPAQAIATERVVDPVPGDRADLTGEQRTTLIHRYAPENERLAALLGDDLDLSLWQLPR